MIIGTAGHIDHGKTSLVQALTGVDTDRLKEEKRRGISIDLGFAYMPAPDGSILGFIDVPGHEKFVHNMLAGASGIDFALLVIAADDGPMPQTVEHLAIIDLLGIKRGLIALTKIDLVDEERLAKVEAEITRLTQGTCLESAEIMSVSTVKGYGIDLLRARLFTSAAEIHRDANAQLFRLAIDRSFTLKGTGTVVTGTVLSGTVGTGDKIIISPNGIEARVRSIHAQNRAAEAGHSGERCALNLVGEAVSKENVTRGAIVLDPLLHQLIDRIDADFKVLATEEKAISQWTPVRLHHASADVGARIVPLCDKPIPPGGEALIQLVLDQPIAATTGDRFVLRDTSAQRTIGGGRFLDLHPPVRKRRTPERLAQLGAMSLDSPARIITGLLSLPPYFMDLKSFARDRAFPDTTVQSIANELALITASSGGALYAMLPEKAREFRHDLLQWLGGFHADNPDLPGIGLEQLRLKISPAIPKMVFVGFLQPLLHDREIALEGAWVRLATHKVQLSPEDDRIWRQILPLIVGDQRFRPPRVRDIADTVDTTEEDIRRLFKTLARMGKVDEIAHDHFFLRDAVAEMVEIIVDLGGHGIKGEFTAAQFRDRVESGRKVAIQSLEFFDRHGVTLRRGDLRRVNAHRLDLFRPILEATDHAA